MSTKISDLPVIEEAHETKALVVPQGEKAVATVVDNVVSTPKCKWWNFVAIFVVSIVVLYSTNFITSMYPIPYLNFYKVPMQSVGITLLMCVFVLAMHKKGTDVTL